jgi:RNA polymerase sigma factor (sigma-70 family)
MDGAAETIASREGVTRPDAGKHGPRPRGGLSPARIAELLDSWRSRELERFARHWRTLGYTGLEDIYSETTIALLKRPYRNERQLRGALRDGLQYRALNTYSTNLRHREIDTETANGISALALAKSAQETPEQLALEHEDELILQELMRELTPFQQQVFALASEGKRYKTIAKALGVTPAQARSATRACESKGKTFLFLYETGRVCGERSETIKALQARQATSKQLAELAAAHLDACARCRAEHGTNGARLRKRFNEQAAAFMPPALILRWSLLTQGSRARAIQRLLPDIGPGRELVRERAAALIATSGVATKLAATALTSAAVIAGSIGVSHIIDHQPPTYRAQPAPQQPQALLVAGDHPTLLLARTAPEPRPMVHAKLATQHERSRHPKSPSNSGRGSMVSAAQGGQREPGDFDEPGAVVEPSRPTPAPEPAKPEGQRGGGPFGP